MENALNYSNINNYNKHFSMNKIVMYTQLKIK